MQIRDRPWKLNYKLTNDKTTVAEKDNNIHVNLRCTQFHAALPVTSVYFRPSVGPSLHNSVLLSYCSLTFLTTHIQTVMNCRFGKPWYMPHNLDR